ncbi:hypothetical protein BJ165DRAFT_1520962 [Panaeolus papilionaceus]|nr:hypothetical protein BJ165DRAFT_1520962 [Panaeolus papilionaceus]
MPLITPPPDVVNNTEIQQSPASPYTLVLITCLPFLGLLFALKWIFVTWRQYKVSKLAVGDVEQITPLQISKLGALHLESPVPSLSASSDKHSTLVSLDNQNSKWRFNKKSAFWVGFLGSPTRESSQQMAVWTKLESVLHHGSSISGKGLQLTSPPCNELGVLNRQKHPPDAPTTAPYEHFHSYLTGGICQFETSVTNPGKLHDTAKVAPHASNNLREKAHISTLDVAPPLPVYRCSNAGPSLDVVTRISAISSPLDALPATLRQSELTSSWTSRALPVKGPLSETRIPVTSPIQLQMGFVEDDKLHCTPIDAALNQLTQPLKPVFRQTYPPVGIGGPRQSRRRTYGHTLRPSPLRNIATYCDESKRHRDSDGLSNIIQELIDEASAWDADLFHDEKFKAMFDQSLKYTTLRPERSVVRADQRFSGQQCVTILEEQEPSSPEIHTDI